MFTGMQGRLHGYFLFPKFFQKLYFMDLFSVYFRDPFNTLQLILALVKGHADFHWSASQVPRK